MGRRYLIKSIRTRLFLLLLVTCFFWFISTDPFEILDFRKENFSLIEYYIHYQDIHVYPPPWFYSNWTIIDYFTRKDRLQVIADQQAISKQQKVIIKNGFLNQKLTKPTDSYLIVEFTPVINAPKFCGKTPEFIFGKHCPYNNCKYTCDRNLSEQADLLLMHHYDIRVENLPTKRDPDQIWLYWQDEPGGARKIFNSYQFNWTISYRFNAEASLAAYGVTVLREKPLSTRQLNAYIDEAFEKRQSRALWFVSNCEAKNRLNYYHQLRLDYPSILVYGHCISSSTNKFPMCARNSECESFNLRSNKFYLAFESQSCRDYTTEKFWRSLAYGIIPIVFGPRTKQSLEQIAPPNSFIYTNDFHSTSQLANYLRQIANNRTLFGEYHQWRRFYNILHQAHELESYRFCELCHRLNVNQDRIYYQDLHSFFSDEC